MTPEAQRITIAEACGWTDLGRVHGPKVTTLNGCPPNNKDAFLNVPDYLNDLNAMHEAEKVLTFSMQVNYAKLLAGHRTSDGWIQNEWAIIHATATQRAEAFLRTLNLWTDTTP